MPTLVVSTDQSLPYFNHHDPPHFHARYQDQEVVVDITTAVVQGRMSARALRMVFEWSEMYRQGLLDNWQRAWERRPLMTIPPLP